MPGDRDHYLEAPPLLSEDRYYQVEQLTLGEPRNDRGEWEQPAGWCVIPKNGQEIPRLTPAHSTNLRQQLHPIVTWPGTLHEKIDNHPPDSFVFIRTAGIALRHTLDGFYDSLDGPRRRRHSPKHPPVALIPTETFKYETWNIQHEADKLKRTLGGSTSHVCLIDNQATFYNDKDLQLAAAVAHAAGAQVVSALRTILYEQIDPRDVDAKKLQVSRHAKFMSRLGKLCCNLDCNPAVS